MASRSPLSSINRETGIRDVASDAQYLSSNCVVYIYYSDLGSVIEEHFSKALNSQQQPNNFSDSKSKDPVIPMSQRNLPLSFWKANFHSPTSNNSSSTSSSSGQHEPSGTQGGTSQESSSSAAASSASASSAVPFFMSPNPQQSSSSSIPGDLYGAEAAAAYHHHHHHHSHHGTRYPIQNDPWHYTLSAATNPYSSHHHHHHTGHHHRGSGGSQSSSSMHDLTGYSSASNRFNAAAQYSSLLLQPRSSRLTPVSGSAFEKTAPDMSWLGAAATRYHHEAAINFGHHHHHHGMEAAAGAYTAASAYGAAMTAAITGMDSH